MQKQYNRRANQRLLYIFIYLIIGSLHVSILAGNVGGDIRGVTFFYLDGGAQDFPWVLDNQYNPDVREKIDNLLAEYRAGGVNWIRLLIASNHFFTQSEIHPIPSAALIKKVNDFMAITRNGENAEKFTIELVLIPQQADWKFTDTYPYERDKLWYKTWIDSLDYSNLGMIMFGGDLSPCWLSGCEGEASAEDIPQNHGEWIKELWSWKESNYPELTASFEVIGIQSLSDNSLLLIKKLANWIDTTTPTNPFVSASLYISLPSGSSSEDYASVTEEILQAYHSVSSKPLWIDEFGHSLGTLWTTQDQRNAYQGFLEASVCLLPNGYPKFAWVAGNDYPYDGQNWFGLVSGFTEERMPIMREAWDDLSFYYNLDDCQTSVKTDELGSDILGSSNLRECFPNPFNPETTIQYSLNETGLISLIVYDALGQKVKTISNKIQQGGKSYKVLWNGKDDFGRKLSSGFYIAVLNTAGFSKSIKMLKIK